MLAAVEGLGACLDAASAYKGVLEVLVVGVVKLKAPEFFVASYLISARSFAI